MTFNVTLTCYNISEAIILKSVDTPDVTAILTKYEAVTFQVTGVWPYVKLPKPMLFFSEVRMRIYQKWIAWRWRRTDGFWFSAPLTTRRRDPHTLPVRAWRYRRTDGTWFPDPLTTKRKDAHTLPVRACFCQSTDGTWFPAPLTTRRRDPHTLPVRVTSVRLLTVPGFRLQWQPDWETHIRYQ